MVPGVAWVSHTRPLPALRVLAAALGALVVARLGWEPRIIGNDLGTTPIFNWLLYGYGIPAAAFWLGGWLLRRRGDGEELSLTESRRARKRLPPISLRSPARCRWPATALRR